MYVRKLTPSDVEQYRKLRLLSLQTDPNAFFLRHEKAITYPLSFFLDEMKRDASDIWGFYGTVEADELVGMVSLQKKSESIGQIYTLYVHPSHQKKGIGKELMQHVIKLASEAGLLVLQLGVIEGNSAIRLYEALGFTFVMKNYGALKNDKGVFDELVYQRELGNL